MKWFAQFGQMALAGIVLAGGIYCLPALSQEKLPPIQVSQSSVSSPDRLYFSGLNRTFKLDFKGAMLDLEQSATGFLRQGAKAKAYRSLALAQYIQEGLDHRQASAGTRNVASWIRMGKCLDDCKYSISWANPAIRGLPYGGILVMEQHVQRVPAAGGGSHSLAGVLDTQVLPALGSGEWVSSNCEEGGKPRENLVAIVQVKGFENADYYTQVRQAWRVNLTTRRLETVTPSKVRCINPCPGGC